jgi:FKBP-type peptidyl-prolyl cis-trans isomerase
MILFTFAAACGGGEGTGTPGNPEPASGPQLPEGAIAQLTPIDVVVGEGAVAEPGATAVVHYTGWLYEPSAPDRRGAKFDSSVDRGAPFTFPLGGGRVIRGWDEGVAGMRVGGKRLLFIPPEYGYGERGAAGGAIPPNATLYFEVDLLELR